MIIKRLSNNFAFWCLRAGKKIKREWASMTVRVFFLLKMCVLSSSRYNNVLARGNSACGVREEAFLLKRGGGGGREGKQPLEPLAA